jgi:AraC-like DNA-binding protein
MGEYLPPRRIAGATPCASTSARVLLSVFSGLPGLLESFRVPSAGILRQYGLTHRDINEPDRSGGYQSMGRLLGQCAELTGCRHFGLLLSRSVNLRSLGLPGRLAQHSATVQEALEGLAGCLELHDSGAELDLRMKAETATYSYSIHASGVVAVEQVYDFTLGAMTNVLRELCGRDWYPTLVTLPRRRPVTLEPYHAILGSSLQFSATSAAVVFPSRWLTQPVPGADPFICRLLCEARAALENTNPLLLRDVRRAIVALLHDGHCSRREVARALDLHERTLSRQLQLSGTTFQHMLDEARSELAQQLLRNTRAPVTQIARQLGFRSSTVMARAFRRWTGVSPRQYRSGQPLAH